MSKESIPVARSFQTTGLAAVAVMIFAVGVFAGHFIVPSRGVPMVEVAVPQAAPPVVETDTLDQALFDAHALTAEQHNLEIIEVWPAMVSVMRDNVRGDCAEFVSVAFNTQVLSKQIDGGLPC